MKRSLAALALIVSVLSATPASAQSLEQQLRQTTQSMLDAIAPGEAGVWAAQIDPAFTHMDETGVVRQREEFLSVLTPLPPGLVGRIEIDTFRVVEHGDVAVTFYEIQEYLDYHGQPIRSRFRSVDTWRRTDAGWRMIAQHTAAVLKDPPAVSLPQSQLCEYAGVYALTADIQLTLRCSEQGLVAERSGRDPVQYRAEVADVFFSPGQPRTRRIFQRNGEGAIVAFVDRREGEDIVWRRTVAVPD